MHVVLSRAFFSGHVSHQGFCSFPLWSHVSTCHMSFPLWSRVLTHVPATRGTPDVFREPFFHVNEMAAMTAALAPYVWTFHHKVTTKKKKKKARYSENYIILAALY